MSKTACNRRNFIQAASLIAAGTAASTKASAAGTGQRDVPIKTSILLKPTPTSPGPVLVKMESLTFVAFDAARDSAPDRTGLCVVTFEGCITHQVRGGDDLEVPHTVDIDSLDPRQIYWIKRSRWVTEAHKLFGRPDPIFRHYVITFLGDNPELVRGPRNFECLAQSHKVDFYRDTSFEDVLADLKMVDLAARS